MSPNDNRARIAAATYEVGYGKPPRSTRFQKGRSGNPRGRPKAAPISDLGEVIDELLDEPVRIRQGGKPRTVARLEYLTRAQMARALKGSSNALLTLLKQAKKAGCFPEQTEIFIELYDPGGELLARYRKTKPNVYR